MLVSRLILLSAFCVLTPCLYGPSHRSCGIELLQGYEADRTLWRYALPLCLFISIDFLHSQDKSQDPTYPQLRHPLGFLSGQSLAKWPKLSQILH